MASGCATLMIVVENTGAVSSTRSFGENPTALVAVPGPFRARTATISGVAADIEMPSMETLVRPPASVHGRTTVYPASGSAGPAITRAPASIPGENAVVDCSCGRGATTAYS